MNILKTLKSARVLIEKPEHWTKEYSARNKNNKPTNVYKKTAYCFCATGAVTHIIGSNTSVNKSIHLSRCIDVLDSHIPKSFTYTFDYNDHLDTTHQNILDLYDRAITAEEAKL